MTSFGLSTTLAALLLSTSGVAHADPQVTPQPHEVKTGEDAAEPAAEESPPWRRLAVELTPLSFIVMRRRGAQIEVVPFSHHGLQASAYEFDWTTGDDSHRNRFRGVGGEIGYRYYFGDAGPRGLFLGPSFLAGTFEGIPRVGDSVPFRTLGGAFDVGYQALLFDRLVIGLGLGLQYTKPTADIPLQEIPASTVANAGLRPRFLFAVGAAFGP